MDPGMKLNELEKLIQEMHLSTIIVTKFFSTSSCFVMNETKQRLPIPSMSERETVSYIGCGTGRKLFFIQNEWGRVKEMLGWVSARTCWRSLETRS